MSRPRRTIGTLNALCLIGIGHYFFVYVGCPRLTVGPSMLPTLQTWGDCIWISKLHRRGRNVQVGDVVSFAHPLIPGETACKRILGMPGDFVLRDTPGGKSDMMIQVPKGHCWLAGDNIDWSRDSRDYGPIPLALINGKATARIWPLSRAKWIENTFTKVHN